MRHYPTPTQPDRCHVGGGAEGGPKIIYLLIFLTVCAVRPCPAQMFALVLFCLYSSSRKPNVGVSEWDKQHVMRLYGVGRGSVWRVTCDGGRQYFLQVKLLTALSTRQRRITPPPRVVTTPRHEIPLFRRLHVFYLFRCCYFKCFRNWNGHVIRWGWVSRWLSRDAELVSWREGGELIIIIKVVLQTNHTRSLSLQ